MERFMVVTIRNNQVGLKPATQILFEEELVVEMPVGFDSLPFGSWSIMGKRHRRTEFVAAPGAPNLYITVFDSQSTAEVLRMMEAIAVHREEHFISPKIVLNLLGGRWPDDNAAAWFADWNKVEYFRSLAPGILQGYDGYGEPIGPAIECQTKTLTMEQVFAK